jgi:hypothetical protein
MSSTATKPIYGDGVLRHDVLVCTVADDPRKATADRLLARGGLISRKC